MMSIQSRLLAMPFLIQHTSNYYQKPVVKVEWLTITIQDAGLFFLTKNWVSKELKTLGSFLKRTFVMNSL